MAGRIGWMGGAVWIDADTHYAGTHPAATNPPSKSAKADCVPL
jgi:hypothetical protein